MFTMKNGSMTRGSAAKRAAYSTRRQVGMSWPPPRWMASACSVTSCMLKRTPRMGSSIIGPSFVAQLKAATAHQADAEHKVVVPRVPVFQKSHKCLDAIVTCSLDGPGLFIAQFHPKIGGQQALKNRYKIMDTFYTDAENERQGAFHKYDAIDEVKLAASLPSKFHELLLERLARRYRKTTEILLLWYRVE